MYFCKAPSQRQPPLLIARLANLKAEMLLLGVKKKSGIHLKACVVSKGSTGPGVAQWHQDDSSLPARGCSNRFNTSTATSQVSHWLFSLLSRSFSLFWPFSTTTWTSRPTGAQSICPSWQLFLLSTFHNKALAQALNKFCHPAPSKMLKEGAWDAAVLLSQKFVLF